MPSINLDLDFFTHPKTDRLVHLLGRNSEVIPIRLWVVTGRHYSDTGKLTGVSAQEIESKVQWWGKSGVCVDALVTCGFLELVGGTYQVHDWLEHSGHIARYRKRAKAAAKARWENATSIKDATSNACSNASALHCNEVKIPLNGSVPKNGIAPSSLGSLWVFHSQRRRGRSKAEDPGDAEKFLRELIRANSITETDLRDEITREARDKTESLGEFRVRFVSRAANGKPVPDILSGLKAAWERAEKNGTLDKEYGT